MAIASIKASHSSPRIERADVDLIGEDEPLTAADEVGMVSPYGHMMRVTCRAWEHGLIEHFPGTQPSIVFASTIPWLTM